MPADSYEDIAVGKGDAVPSLEVQPQELYHAKSFWTRCFSFILVNASATRFSRISSIYWSS